MSAYKAYSWERDTWPDYQTVMLDIDEQKKYLKKLCRHFKVEPLALRTYNTQSPWRGYCSYAGYTMLGPVTAMGTLIHEFAHWLAFNRWREQIAGKPHGKKFKRELKRCYTFAKRWLPVATSSEVVPETIPVEGELGLTKDEPEELLV